MTVIRVNAGHAPPARLWRLAAELPPGAPVVVMVHGYRYSPSHPRHDPHRHILSLDPAPGAARVASWPRGLGFAPDSDRAGLAVALGWEARGALGSAYRRAGETGEVLARLAGDLAQAAGRPVALIGHSLGGRVCLSALAGAEAGSLSRLVLLNAAAFRDEATEALSRPAATRAEILNITSRENDLFDFGLEQVLALGRRRALGLGLGGAARNWLDIQIDDAAVLDALEGLGFPTERRAARLSHWSSYLRGGLFDLYRRALCQPRELPLALLRAHLPQDHQPRWTRLWWARDRLRPSEPGAAALPLR